MDDDKTTPEAEAEEIPDLTTDPVPTDDEVAAVAKEYKGKKADFPAVRRPRTGMPPGPEV